MKIIIFSVLLVVLSCTNNIITGKDVIEKMHHKYNQTWYKTLTFNQKTIWYKQDGSEQRTQVWLEALKMPGNLIIKFDSISSGTGILFKNDKMYQFNNGTLAGSVDRKHELLILGFDVYFDKVQNTMDKLKDLKFDLNYTYEDKIDGREVYVVGQNQKTDSLMNHFVIDKERLVFLYLKKLNPRNNSINKTVFTDYEKFDGGWVGKEVNFYINDQLFLKEIYRDVKINMNLSDDLFSEEKFKEAMW